MNNEPTKRVAEYHEATRLSEYWGRLVKFHTEWAAREARAARYEQAEKHAELARQAELARAEYRAEANRLYAQIMQDADEADKEAE